MIKTFIEDTGALRIAAVEIAGIKNDTERGIALSFLFEACGELALTYARPAGVVGRLTGVVAEEFQAERQRLRIRAELGEAA
ncbi:hypothetical protein P3T27_002141 [Kitasatospora sp. MAA19]|uniref:hypothetical protein n=1 Tax=Kitasatospora sp. MAA19 TaxID=3035090 RepID=UPI002476D602|nr:hypothetical protein [Kitasatospora sp. MAA19]MDH6705431.1 hypothetical protein [Kitasatospora sp. MAA19]